MFEFDAGKLVIIGIVALIVIGPKELPRVMRQVGQAVGKLRRLGAEFQAQFMEAIREADAEEIKAEMRRLSDSAKVDVGPDPLALAKAEISSALEQKIETREEMAAEPAAQSSEEKPLEPAALSAPPAPPA
ncbi:MAG TPA: twin-arginine translocase TatA/TatE family subunit [Methylovirgula sp.]|nr:twin-arginine translocase TatA/TatE family subunit [Methylovirgula sp.]